jgi:hypothetical protein
VWFIWNGRLAANIHSGRSSYRRGTTLKELKVLPEPARVRKAGGSLSACSPVTLSVPLCQGLRRWTDFLIILSGTLWLIPT